jgi:hypothetical protein
VKNITFYIGHSFDLAYYYRLIPLIKSFGNFKISCIIIKNVYILQVQNIDFYLKTLFDDVIIIEQEYIPHEFSLNFISNFKKIFYVLNKIKSIENKEILISFDKSSQIISVIKSRFKKSILLQTYSKENISKNYKLGVLPTIVSNFYNVISGANFKIIKINKFSNLIVHHHIIKEKSEVIFLSNNVNIANRFSLNYLNSNQIKIKKVLIFGSRFLSWDYFNKSHIHKLLKVYRLLLEAYPESSFFYKPHPLEKGVEFQFLQKHVFGNRISLISDIVNTEFFLLNKSDFSFTFSIGSTSSRSAYDFGVNSYVFYKYLQLPFEIEATYDNIFIDQPNEFFIYKLETINTLPPLGFYDSYMEYFERVIKGLQSN